MATRIGPRSVLEHVLMIGDLVADDPHLAVMAGAIEGAGAAFARGYLPWQQGGAFATTNDFDGDGVPDAFDHHWGPGAHSPV